MFLLLLLSSRRSFQRLEDRIAKLRSVEPALDLASLHERNQPGLFRHHHGHGISVFRHTNGRTMTRTKISRKPWIQCQRQKAGSCRDAMTSHDNRAIVKRTLRVEN